MISAVENRALVYASVAAVLGLALLLIDPRGDFPLNDDWIFARITKDFSDTGRFGIDGRPSAPNVFGQSLVALPFIELFGFSHRLLRGITLLSALVILWALDRLLELGGCRPLFRALALCLLVLNPLFLYASLTFMTEIHGLLPPMLGAVVWMAARKRRETAADETLIGVGPAVAAAALVAWSFATRQTYVLFFPALVGATVLHAVAGRAWRRLARSLPALFLAALAFGAVILTFDLWTQATKSASPILGKKWLRFGDFDRYTLISHPGIFLTYMTAFLLPVMALVRFDAARRRRGIALAALAAALAIVLTSFYWVRLMFENDFNVYEYGHRVFPFLGNIIYNAGVGPITTSDIFELDLPLRPHWSLGTWEAIGAVLMGLSALWGALVLEGCAVARAARGSLLAELVLFGVLLGFGGLAAYVVVHGYYFFDRYYLPSLVALLLSATLVASASGSHPATPSRRRLAGFLVALAPLACFTVAGLHDMFRWNEARWELNRQLHAAGISPRSIQAGWEIEGWFAFEDDRRGIPSPSCIGPCTRSAGFYCHDDSYRIGMNVYGGYEVGASIQPSYWLADGPPIVLSRRPLP